MNHDHHYKIVPPQEIGRNSSAEAHRECETREEALEIYREARTRLLDINRWDKYAGVAEGTFQLTDFDGNEVDRSPEIGDLIRINIPGPESNAGDGYDWVGIEAYIETVDLGRDIDLFAFRVRPAARPGASHDTTAHFFTDDATDTFLLQRAGNRVTAAEKGRNEVANVHTGDSDDDLRNMVIGAGATSGIPIPRWKTLMKGILATSPES